MRVLLVEDDALVGKATRIGLEQAGFVVDHVSNQRQVAQSFKHESRIFKGSAVVDKNIATVLLVILFSSSTLSLAHSNHQQSNAQHDEQVELSMKKMQRAYRKALRSDNIQQMKYAVAQLIEISQHTSTLRYGINRTEQTDYQKGMQRLHLDLQRLNAAVAANDLPLARKILTTQIKATRNQSHEKLGINED